MRIKCDFGVLFDKFESIAWPIIAAFKGTQSYRECFCFKFVEQLIYEVG